MASTDGLVPITREFLASYYDKYPFQPLSDNVSRLSSQIRTCALELLKHSPPSQDERLLVEEAERAPPHKVDENMWKNREHIEQVLFLLDKSNWPAAVLKHPSTPDVSATFDQLRDQLCTTLKIVKSFQLKNSERVFNIVMTYLPQDFRGTIIRQQKERSERNKQAEVDALVASGASIHERYALLWRQQMDRRRQLAQLGSATGVYKTLVKYLVGVPQVLLDFVRQLNDDDGPMEEQRQRYGPSLYSLTTLILCIRLYMSLLWGRFDANKLKNDDVTVLKQAVFIYTSELERFLKFISEVFANSPFFISADVSSALESRKYDDFKEVTVPAGKTHEVLMEELVGVTACVLGDMASRPNFGLNELDFVFSTLVVGSIMNFTLMYLLAPTTTLVTLPAIFANCPTSHMFQPGPFSLLHRLGTCVYKGTLFAAVGFAAGLFGTALSNGLIATRKKMDPDFQTPNKPPPTVLNATTWAIHMGLSSNLRLTGSQSVVAITEEEKHRLVDGSQDD